MSVAHKLNKHAFYIDWNNHTIEEIDRLYRALNDVVNDRRISSFAIEFFQANLRTLFRQKPVRLKFLTPIVDTQILEQLNTISSKPGRAIYSQSLNCICIRCKVIDSTRDFQSPFFSITDIFRMVGLALEN